MIIIITRSVCFGGGRTRVKEASTPANRKASLLGQGRRVHHETRRPRQLGERLTCSPDQRWLRGTTEERHRQQYSHQRADHRHSDCDNGVESHICRYCSWQTACCTWCSSPPHSVSSTGNWRRRYLSGWCGRWFIHYSSRPGGRKLLCLVDVDSMAHVETEG